MSLGCVWSFVVSELVEFSSSFVSLNTAIKQNWLLGISLSMYIQIIRAEKHTKKYLTLSTEKTVSILASFSSLVL